MTHEEWLFQEQVMGFNHKHHIKDGVLYITSRCSDAMIELPDNISFKYDLWISREMKALPKGLSVGGGLFMHSNPYIIETPSCLKVNLDHFFGDCQNLKHLKHLSSKSVIDGHLDISDTMVNTLPIGMVVIGGIDTVNTDISYVQFDDKYKLIHYSTGTGRVIP